MNSADRAQVAGTIHEGEYWLRCPYCGDTDKNPEKAHYSIQLSTGAFFCLRCNASGRMSAKDRYQLVGNLPLAIDTSQDRSDDSDDAFIQIYERLEEGAGLARKSALDRYHYIDDSYRKWDAFIAYEVSTGEAIGVSLRLADPRQKVTYFYGTRGHSWVGDHLPDSISKPLRIVEGPYDVLTPQDVCIFGVISEYTLRDLAGHNVILCPDGDVWTEQNLRKQWLATLRYLLYTERAKPYLLGVEYLPDKKDPDEVLPEDRHFFKRAWLYKFFQGGIIHDPVLK